MSRAHQCTAGKEMRSYLPVAFRLSHLISTSRSFSRERQSRQQTKEKEPHVPGSVAQLLSQSPEWQKQRFARLFDDALSLQRHCDLNPHIHQGLRAHKTPTLFANRCDEQTIEPRSKRHLQQKQDRLAKRETAKQTREDDWPAITAREN